MQEYITYLQNLLKENNIPFKPFIEQQIQQTNQFGYDHINRYKRQMILSEISLEGQEKIFNTKVLVIGAGGIGAPASLYLAGAGVGTIGLVDGDQVELSNLHRQIIHTTNRIGMNKPESAKQQLNQYNPLINVETYNYHLTQQNAIELFQKYDIILDATDNPKSRYLINDAAIFLNKPLVSGSSVGWEGQITVYGLQGPCYRCLYPECPKNVKNCSEAGVFGVMPGLIGLIEALQATKIILGQPYLQEKLLIIDGLADHYRVCKIRGKQKNCQACNKQIKIKEYDYDTFTAAICSQSVSYNGTYNEITWQQYVQMPKNKEKQIFIDVRPENQFKIVRLDGFINIPYTDIDKFSPDLDSDIYIMCRRGNSSRLACEYLQKNYKNVTNIIGGIDEYAKHYDPKMPLL